MKVGTRSGERPVYSSRKEPAGASSARSGWLRGGLVLVTVFALISVVGFVGGTRSGEELQQLLDENARLREINRSFEANLQSLQARLAAQESRTSELAIVAGIADASTRIDGIADDAAAGVGGTANELQPDLGTLNQRADTLTHRLDDIVSGLDERDHRISARPSLTPARGIVTSGYGERTDPITGSKAFHRGIDISAPPGNLVFATADGVVTQTGRNGNFGKTISISHGFGYQTLYAHLSNIEVSPGETVARGQAIGNVGRSGRATGYHVHYEVQLNGRSRNPIRHILD